MKHFHAESQFASEPWNATVEAVAKRLADTAIERDRAGGTAKAERDVIRESGLLTLSTPVELGGLGADWTSVLDVVRRFAEVDSSLAHLFGFHHLLLATTRLFGRESQWAPWYEHSARHRWFWGNALNPLDRGARATPDPDAEGGFLFSGTKRFCSGASDSDMLVASAFTHDDRLLIGVVPTTRAGISIRDDWDNMGQRQTDSGTVDFNAVRFDADALLTDPGPLSTPFACLRPLLAQLILSNIYLGLGNGALREARAFVQTNQRPWIASTAATPQQDPYVLTHFGDFWLGLESARLLTSRAAALFDDAWRHGASLTEAQRGETAIAVAAAKVASTRAGLDVAHRMFEVTGARATTAALRLDRYWRNLRVHTLHDPVDYKVRELGDWALNDGLPRPSFYS
ncbi:acyl-CoA dehydrogenase family protein [Pararobbsia silviterrae]|uniref:Dibenzothiophene monooxygenase n=1 Tax=Pararobbsia silviterrae TaxID=1792498 RepID=A0A494YAV1_9BURK|nr:acyl-CoA dehydrogenase family protein [Pararobbsia silviterrae]RKP58870.1 monooxygenase [Pararobbsia silviterrae]